MTKLLAPESLILTPTLIFQVWYGWQRITPNKDRNRWDGKQVRKPRSIAGWGLGLQSISCGCWEGGWKGSRHQVTTDSLRQAREINILSWIKGRTTQVFSKKWHDQIYLAKIVLLSEKNGLEKMWKQRVVSWKKILQSNIWIDSLSDTSFIMFDDFPWSECGVWLTKCHIIWTISNCA